VLLLNVCLLLKAYISLSTQFGNFWIHPRTLCVRMVKMVVEKSFKTLLSCHNTTLLHNQEDLDLLESSPQSIHQISHMGVHFHLHSKQLDVMLTLVNAMIFTVRWNHCECELQWGERRRKVPWKRGFGGLLAVRGPLSDAVPCSVSCGSTKMHCTVP
jgi:hypothetical protein